MKALARLNICAVLTAFISHIYITTKISIIGLFLFCRVLTLSQIDLPTFISGTSSFPISGLLGGICHFSPFNRIFCKQTVKILIRHRIMRCLIWVCTVCLCPIKRNLGLYGFMVLFKNTINSTFAIQLKFYSTNMSRDDMCIN